MANFKLGVAIPQLPTGNIETTAQFYLEKLGFEVVARYPDQGFLILKRGMAELHFWTTPDEKTARVVGAESSCYIRVENIQALSDDLHARRAPFRAELERKPWGMLEMQIEDPYGNAIRFGEAAP